MKKFISLAIVIAFLSFVSLSYAAVGYQKEGANSGQITDLNIQGNSTFNGSVLTIITNGHKDSVTTNVSGETNLTSAALAYGTILLSDTGALDGGADDRYISLANGVKGQIITITLLTATGGILYITDDKVATAGMTKTGWDDIAFNAAFDTVTLLYVDDTYGWIVIGGLGVAVT